MTEDDLTGYSSTAAADRMAAVLEPPQRRRRQRRWLLRREKRYNRRIRWVRLLALLVPLCFLALISVVFGMVLAVRAADRPAGQEPQGPLHAGCQLGAPERAAQRPADRDPDRPPAVLPRAQRHPPGLADRARRHRRRGQALHDPTGDRLPRRRARARRRRVRRRRHAGRLDDHRAVRQDRARSGRA